ncbi:MAG TPA: DUF222 domain-containing protein [Acidimicrobiales bacterium]|nr:DUF222 domain-containing protein [Acidimicrobiales bacterium]
MGIANLRESLAGYAARFDATLLSAGQAGEVMEQASRIEKVAATLKALAAARVAETGSWRADGDRSAAHHLARRTGTSVVDAAAAIDTARRLDSLPETSAAARRGELSPEQTSAIADAAGADPAAERALLEAARCVPLAELREQCARAKAASSVDLEVRRARIHQRRSLRSYTDAEGEWHLHCRNNPEVGARIMATVELFREEIFRRARSADRREPPEAYAADALAEMARWSQSRGPVVPDAAEAGAKPERGIPCEAGAGPGGTARKSPATAPPRARSSGPPKFIVRVDLGALLRGWPIDGEVCEIAGFGPVAVSAVRDMIDSDDPFLAAVVTRGERVLGVAHLGRRPNASQQTALQWLYPSCANEGCTARARLDYDHRLDWADSHFTVLDLLDRLCGHCHALKTRQNWSLVEGRGKRPLVPPDDPRHPGHRVELRMNGPPRR